MKLLPILLLFGSLAAIADPKTKSDRNVEYIKKVLDAKCKQVEQSEALEDFLHATVEYNRAVDDLLELYDIE